MSMNIVINIVFFCIDALIWLYLWKKCIFQLRSTERAVRDTIEELAPFSAEDYTARYEDVKRLVKNNGILKNTWNDFDKSVVKYTNADGTHSVYVTVDAGEIFSFANITKHMSVAYWQNFGGVFTGVGILGTFLGLVLGLDSVDLTSSDVSVLKDGIGRLLGGISVAFMTSLIGILCALAYGAVHHHYTAALENSIAVFADRIETMYPRRTAEQWLAESYRESTQQTLTLKNLSQDMAETLGEMLESTFSSGFDELCQKLDSQMRPVFEKLYDVIEALNHDGVSTIASSMSEKAGAQLESFTASLQEIRAAIRETLDASHRMTADANGLMLTTMEQIGKALSDGADDAVQKQKEAADRMAARIEELFATLEQKSGNMMTQISAAGADAEDARQKMGDAVQLLHQTIQGHNDAMEDSYAKIAEMAGALGSLVSEARASGEIMKDAAQPIREASDRLRAGLERLHEESERVHRSIAAQMEQLAQFGTRTEQNMQNLLKAVEKSEQKTAEAWQRYEDNFQNVSGEIERTTNIITERLSEYNEVMNKSMKDQLKVFDDSMGNAVSHLSEVVDELGEIVEDVTGNRRSERSR